MLRRCAVLMMCTLSACEFQVDGVDLPTDLDPPDLSVEDAEEVDLFVPDLSEDLVGNADFSDVDFSTSAIDLAGVDLTPPIVGFPSHVGYHYLVDSAAEWTVAQNTTIDTTLLTISSPTPAGLIFVVDGPYAVLALKTLKVGSAQQADVRLSIIGNRPLLIIAGNEIHIYGLIDAGAHTSVAGAAGGRAATGDGKGVSATAPRTGGGGAGYGSVGGQGGGNPPVGAGPMYGDPALASFVGGSGGGAGALGVTVRANCTSPSPGGAGGGVLQLSARSIVLESDTNNARSTISVAGGGGAGGCGASDTGSGGGGGGAGGALLIEAPSLTLMGRIVASGGGGGGGSMAGKNPSQFLDGREGYDGFVPALPQLSSGGGIGLSSGGAGYNGLVAAPPSAKDGGWRNNPGASSGGGGGGGGAGRIRIRTSIAQNPAKATPPPSVIVDLPATIP